MARCTTTRNLEVHHVRRNGGNDLANAKVLCQSCHEKTSTYGDPGHSPPPFDEHTKQAALHRAGNQCQCTSTQGCHADGFWVVRKR
jgi:5-methylcytosine-specific restriction endonuclease McrA